MNYDVGIYAGHGLGDPGACHGNYKESERKVRRKYWI